MADEANQSPAPSTAGNGASVKLKVAGTWSGALEVFPETWTLAMLREEVARLAGGAAPPERINLICGGKLLKEEDGGKSLSSLGIKNNAKVLATVVSGDGGKAINDQAAAEAEHARKLARIKDAARALTDRHSDGSVPLEDYNIELEDQNGQKVNFGSETDKKALMMGLMLHTSARSLIKKKEFKDALDVLQMAEEAFSLCGSKFTEMIDNLPILQLDTVWCYFMLRDISCLTMAGIRLEKARKGFERSHGKDSTRFRLLQTGSQADLAIYLRLELLEGVVAYHSGNLKDARKALSSAQAKYVQLQVPDEALSLLMSMGYKERAAKRALKMAGQDIQSAVDFLVEERARKMRRKQENYQRQAEILEQKRYGVTPKKKAVDMQRLSELVSLGFERYLAAEALRINENDAEKALDLLTDPEKNCELQSNLEAKKRSRTSQPTNGDEEVPISMEHDQLSGPQLAEATGASNSQHNVTDQPTSIQEGQSSAAADDFHHEGVEEGHTVGRDEEMEHELATEITGDPLADYDLDIIVEGEAISQYLAMLDSTSSS